MTNLEIAAVFREIASLLEKKKENWFKIRAYRKVAEEIEKLTVELSQLANEDKLREIPGVGEAIEKKITEMLRYRPIAVLRETEGRSRGEYQ